MTRVQLWRARGIPGFLLCKIDAETGCYQTGEENSVLIQTDWDYPGVARTFGWDIRKTQLPFDYCEHPATDGTVKCRECGLTASTFISDAADYLDQNLGAIVDDPGYFQNSTGEVKA